MKNIEERLFQMAARLYDFAHWDIPPTDEPTARRYMLDTESARLTSEWRYAPRVSAPGEFYTIIERVVDSSGRRFSVTVSVFADSQSARSHLQHILARSAPDMRCGNSAVRVGEYRFGLAPMTEGSLCFVRRNVVVCIGELSAEPHGEAVLQLATMIDTQVQTAK